MCGIIGYIGEQKAAPLLIEGLKRLEYRGYDSAGIATVSDEPLTLHELTTYRVVGKVEGLDGLGTKLPGSLGIGHTRWATHGAPSKENAHPHRSGAVSVVHNGIIENHEELRRELILQGFKFRSVTDTEVLPHLINRELKNGVNSLSGAVAKALTQVEGAYAIAVVSSEHGDELVAACNSSPLVVGIGKNELYVASDELALAGKVDAVAHLKDGELVVLKRNGSYMFRGISLNEVKTRLEKPSVADEISKGGHTHYMYKEILEQPQAMRNVLAGRLREGSPVTFGGFTPDIEGRLEDARRITLVGCGTSLFAAMAGKAFIERLARVVCEAEQAAEFYRDPMLSSGDVVVGVSQSGETADTLHAMALAREHHALCLGVTNRVGSALSKRVRAGIYLHAGPEVAVASTKAFTAQAAALLLFAVHLAELQKRPVSGALLGQLLLLPALMADTLQKEDEIKRTAYQCKDAKRMIVIGRGYGLPLALEAALKIREVAYLDAHGLSASELKHGTLALVEPGVPVVAIMPSGALRDKMLSNLEEVKARGGRVIPIEPPASLPDELVPIVLAPLVQLLAYHLGVAREVDVDQPRNLAKSVTVE